MGLAKGEWTLRDARRVLSSFPSVEVKYLGSYIGDVYKTTRFSYAGRLFTEVSEVPVFHIWGRKALAKCESAKEVLRVLDRLISIEGPSALLEEPKEEQAGKESGDSPNTGSDGRATGPGDGEGEAESKGSGVAPTSGDRSQAHKGQGDRQVAPGGRGKEPTSDAQGEGSGETRDDGSPHLNPKSRPSTPPTQEVSSLGGQGSSEGSEQDSSQKEPSWDSSECSQGTSDPRKGCFAYGGNYSDYNLSLALSKGLGGEGRRVRSLLRRIFQGWQQSAVATDLSPRLNGKALVRELAGKSLRLSRVRKEEMTRPVCLLLADVSGSCSACCKETLAAALAIAKNPGTLRFAVIAHSNGFPQFAEGDAEVISALHKIGRVTGDWDPQAMKPLLGLCIAGTMAFGDSDAAWLYEQLAEKAPLVWLDSYASRYGPKPASRFAREVAAGWRKQPVCWWQGVNDVSSTVEALRAALHK